MHPHTETNEATDVGVCSRLGSGGASHGPRLVVRSILVVVLLATCIAGVSAATDVDDEIVVTFDGDVVTAGSVDDEVVPNSPHLTADSDRLVVSGGVVETTSGDQVEVDGSELTVDDTADPNVLVSHDGSVHSLSVDDEDGTVALSDDGELIAETSDGTPIEFPAYDDARFAVEIRSVEDGIGEGADLTIEAEFTKLEFADLTEDLNVTLLDAERTVVNSDTFEVDLDAVEQTESIAFETDAGDHEAIDLELELPGSGSDFAPISIEESMWHVSMGADVTDQAPTVGDTLTVDAEIERRGSVTETGAGTVTFEVRNNSRFEPIDSRTLELDEGETERLTFEYDTLEGDEPDVDVRVSSPDDRNETTIPVFSDETLAENVDIEIVDTNRPDVGENLEITGEFSYADPRIVPDEPQEYPINLSVDGTVADERTVVLDGRETVTETFTYDTVPADPPRVMAILEGPATSDEVQPRVIGTGFEVSIVELSDPVNESETLTAIARIENTGEAPDTQTIGMTVAGVLSDPATATDRFVDTETISLGVGESTTERFTYRTDGDDVPETDITIQSEDDEAIEWVTVRSQSSWYAASDLEASFDEDEETVHVSTVIQNEGLTADDQYVELHVGDEIEHIDRLALAPWDERRVETEVDAPADGTYDLRAVTDNVTEGEPAALVVDRPEPEPTNETEERESEEDSLIDVSWLPSIPTPDVSLPSRPVLGVAVFGLLVALLAYRRGLKRPSIGGVRASITGFPGRVRSRVARTIAVVRTGDIGSMLVLVRQVLRLGSATLYVRNELPEAASVTVNCNTDDEAVIDTELTIGPDERETIGSLPDVDRYSVGAGVEQITHEESFHHVDADVGVVLKPEGILIAKLR